MTLALSDILVTPRKYNSVAYGNTENDLSNGAPVRLYQIVMTSSYYAGHMQVWDSLVAGSGTQIKLMALSYYPCKIDFGPTGIQFPNGLSVNWGTNPYAGVAQIYSYGSYYYAASGTIVWSPE